MITRGWYPVFIRQMLIFRRKFMKMGYVFSAMMMPVVYLIAFGFGLGGRVKIEGTDYLTFLVPGIAAMSSMNNSYNWIANSLNFNRLHFKTFQIFIQAPVSHYSIITGEIMAGMIRGLFASLFIIIAGLVFSGFYVTLPFVAALFLNCFLFSALGVVIGMTTKAFEETSVWSNFLIMPMAFFCGTFFPVENMSRSLKFLIYAMPLTHTNILIRKQHFDSGAVISMSVILLYSSVFFAMGSRLIKNYNE